MKILILQLARLGDIYQTWPTVRALKRTLGSDVQVDMLIRSRFAAATMAAAASPGQNSRMDRRHRPGRRHPGPRRRTARSRSPNRRRPVPRPA